MNDAIVVGAGIIGSAIAYRLSQAGAKVTVLDAGDRTPTTATSVAWTNSNNKQPFEYHLLNVAGMGEHLALELEFEDWNFWHHTGNVEWAIGGVERDALAAKVQRLRGWGYQAELIERDAVRAIDPALVPPDDVSAFAFFASEGYVDAVPLAASLLERARALGAQVQRGRTVTSLPELKGKSQNVIVAAGRWTGALLATTGFDLPMAPTRSCLAVTSPANARLRTMLNSSAINVRPDGGGRLLLQNTSTDLPGDEPVQTVPAEKVDELLLSRARRVIRGLDDAKVETAKLGIRSIPGDGHPVAGHLPGNEWVYAVCSHSGVTLAPFFARAVTRELLRGSREERLAPFRPERFCAAAASR
jgi:glycine/D-amino acid oxidase-like deaminating enzyme